MQITVLHFDPKTEQTDSVTLQIDNVERDSPNEVTIYSTQPDGVVGYFVLDQELITAIREAKQT